MQKKALSIALVAAFMFAAFGGLFVSAEDSDATATASGAYSVYVYNGTGWQSSTVNQNVYDAAQAVKQSGFWQSGDVMVEKFVPGTWVTYNSTTYGNITTFMGLTNGVNDNYWKVFVADSNLSVSEATVSLGNYTCFDDYSYVSANIILYYGADSITASAVQNSLALYYLFGLVVSTTPVTHVSSGDDGFKFTFALHMDTQINPVNNQEIYTDIHGVYSGMTALTGGSSIAVTDANLKSSVIYLTGYGSNAYLALKQVITNSYDLVAGTSVSNYSWIDTFLGLGTIQTAGLNTPDWSDDNYAYWIIYDEHGYFGDNPNHVGDFVLGAYAPMSFAPIYDQTIALVFGEYTM